MTELPDLARSAALLRISVELEDIPEDSVMALSIKKGVRNNDLRGALNMIVEQARDNRALMADIVGNELLERIEKHWRP